MVCFIKSLSSGLWQPEIVMNIEVLASKSHLNKKLLLLEVLATVMFQHWHDNV